MADTKISALPELTGANTASADMIPIVDQSAVQTKKITLGELQAAPVSAGTANGILYLNGSKVATSGSALTFDGTNLAVSRNGGGTLTALVEQLDSSGATLAQFKATHGSGSILLLSTGDGFSNIGNVTAVPMVFTVNNAEQMRLTSTGLGIGTSSPQAKLHIEAATTCTARITSTGNSNLDLVATATTVEVGSPNGVNLLFKTGGTERGRFDNSGNLGLGVTPSAWTSYLAMQIGPRASIAATSNTANVGCNWYFDGAEKYIDSGFATLYQQYNGAHAWFTAPSGTAGNPISFSQVMTLTAGGNLGVGTTNPPLKLSVLSGVTTSDTSTPVVMLGSDRNDYYASINSVRGGASTYIGLSFSTSNNAAPAEVMRLDPAGNLIQKVNGTAPTLTTNGTMSFELTSNTSLKIVVRGSDNVTRSVSLTLA